MSTYETPVPEAGETTIDEKLNDLIAQAGGARDQLNTALVNSLRTLREALKDPEKREQLAEALKRRDIKCGDSDEAFCLSVAKLVFSGDGPSGHTKKGKSLYYLLTKDIPPERALEEIKKITIKGMAEAMRKTVKPQGHAVMRAKMSVELSDYIRGREDGDEVTVTLVVRKNANGVPHFEVTKASALPSREGVPDESSNKAMPRFASPLAPINAAAGGHASL